MPLPPGFQIEGQGNLPPGFTLEQAEAKGRQTLAQVPYNVGGKVTDFASQYLPPGGAAAVGTAANAGLHALPMLIGGGIGQGIASAGKGMGRWLMDNALKPGIGVATAAREKAVQTLLDEGINISKGGVEKAHGLVDALNEKIRQQIGSSSATVNKGDVLSELQGTVGKFEKQVNPQSDLRAIEEVRSSFNEHPLLTNLNARENELANIVKQKEASRISALQDAGRYKTMAAQQDSLAHGNILTLRGGEAHTPNVPYFNTGYLGREVRSPSAYPVEGMPRAPSQYTHNMERVPEAQSAAADAMQIAQQRRIELQQAQKNLEEYLASGKRDGIPAQLAQELKQGTYRVLKGKYGEQGSAATEAQKDLARGLKEGVAKAVPEIAGLNAQESALLQTLPLLERRVLVEANRNPGGLAFLAHNPAAAAAFMADKSSIFKSMMARLLYSGTGQAPGVGAVSAGALAQQLGQPPRE